MEAGTEVLPISVDALRLCSSGGAEARRHDVVGTAVGRAAGCPCISGAAGAGRDHVLGTAVRCAAGRAGALGRRAKRSQVRFERPEAGSLDSFDDAFLSCRIESPLSRFARVTSALHNLCPVHSSSIPAHNSHARMPHARCVVNSVGDTEDGRRLSCVYGGTKSTSTSTRTGVRCPAVENLASPQQAPGSLHDEMWASTFQKQGSQIFREMEIVPGCAVRVACPSCPDYSPEPPRPHRIIGNMLGWSLLEETARSGVWVFRGALQGEERNFFLSMTQQETGRGRGRTAQRGGSPVIPHVLVHMRMDMAPLSGRTLESGAGHC